MSGYWFYHEYRDEERRERVHRIEADTESEARRLHRQACDFHWVTQHVDPSVSSLFREGDYGAMPIAAGCRHGDPYPQNPAAVPMPDYIRQMLVGFRMGDG